MAFNENKLGELRPNQIITTFGPGSIVDAVKDSVTVLDTNYWTERGKKIIDGRLASYLGVDCFYMPRTSYMGGCAGSNISLYACVFKPEMWQTFRCERRF